MVDNVRVVLQRADLLGESPVWSAEAAALFWVDIRKPSIQKWSPATGALQSWAMPADIGSIGLRRAGGLVAALRSGFATIDLRDGRVHPIANPLAGTTDLRFNDGRCDRAGRFLAGTVQEKRVAGLAALYRLDPDHRVTTLVEGLTVTNGLSWSPDDRTLYFADSHTREIFACDYDIDSGTIARRRVFARFGPDEGIPDGATVDSAGCLWIAHFDGWRVTRFTPEGEVDRVVRMPVPRPTSCEFGGRGCARST